MLHTQPIKAPRILQGEYISVMSRHTLNDDVTPDPRIGLHDVAHLPVLAPPPRLVGDWYRGRLGYQDERTFEEQFRPRYLDWLSNHAAEVRQLGEQACRRDVIALCIEPTPSDGEMLLCHRRLLAEECLRLVDELEVNIK